MSQSQRCSATTKAGAPCNAWAVRGSDPPLCSAHLGRNVGAGAPLNNQNALTHGFYSGTLKPEELAELVAVADDDTLTDEIAIARVLLRRLMEHLQAVDSRPKELKSVAPLILQTTGRIGRLLRDQRAISGEAADGISGAMAQALDELSTEWGIEL